MLDCKIKVNQQRILDFSIRSRILVLSLLASHVTSLCFPGLISKAVGKDYLMLRPQSFVGQMQWGDGQGSLLERTIHAWNLIVTGEQRSQPCEKGDRAFNSGWPWRLGLCKQVMEMRPGEARHSLSWVGLGSWEGGAGLWPARTGLLGCFIAWLPLPCASEQYTCWTLRSKLCIYSLLISRGIALFRNPVEIGKTKLSGPVDIVLGVNEIACVQVLMLNSEL